jgi:hypothetical protein
VKLTEITAALYEDKREFMACLVGTVTMLTLVETVTCGSLPLIAMLPWYHVYHGWYRYHGYLGWKCCLWFITCDCCVTLVPCLPWLVPLPWLPWWELLPVVHYL